MIKKNSLKLLELICIGFIAYLLGYVRNFLFVTINAQSSAVYYRDVRPPLPSLLEFIGNKDYAYLIRLKWVLTLLFAVSFCLLALAGIKYIFKEKIYAQLCLVFYGAISLISLVFMTIGILLPSFSIHTYNIARNLIHLVQSPFTVLLLYILIYYHKRTSSA